MGSPSSHAILSPSSAHRWLTCTPSARLGEKLRERLGEETSPFAEEGTRAHALAEIKVRRAIWENDGMTPERLDGMSPNEREAYQGINPLRYAAIRKTLGDIPKDMEQATDTYLDVVMGKYLEARDQDPSTRILLEQKLSMTRWVPRGFGSSDCVIVSDTRLEVLDYKHGKGIPVDAHDNPQCRLYGLGAYDRFRVLYDFGEVRMTIIQPRLDSVSEETISTDELLEWADEIAPKAQMAWDGEGEFIPGDHCRFCPAKAVCAARVSESLKLFYEGLQSPATIPDERIPDLMKVLDIAKSWIGDFEKYVYDQAIKGQKWKGYKLVKGRQPNMKWTDPEETKLRLLEAGYTIEQIQETKLKTPAEVRKELGKKVFDGLVKDLTTRGEAKLTLVPEEDKREEFDSADAAFADLVGDNN